MDNITTTQDTTRGPASGIRRQRRALRAGRIGGWLSAAALALASVQPATAISILKEFQGDPSDGQFPKSAVVGDGAGNLYGTTLNGGGADKGTVFTVKANGTGFTVLHSFTGSAADGDSPYGSLVLDGAGNLYGTTTYGGVSDAGTVFTVKTNGTGFALLHSFAGGATDGRSPQASLILDGSGNLYGTTVYGGGADVGTVFTVKTSGTGFALLHSFANVLSDGIYPRGSLVLDGSGNLYCTTSSGGASGVGTVFTVKTNGTGFALLHSFAGGATEGASPEASLILDGAGNLYGTTIRGSVSNQGTVFTGKTNGTAFTVLHSFTSVPADGADPYASLVLDGAGNLYGTTQYGGASTVGTVFFVKTDGTGFTVLHEFAGNSSEGVYPYGSLILDGAGNLYGTTYSGGASGTGTVFTVKTNGTDFAVLHAFAWSPTDGAFPQASLVLDGAGNLYGTTYSGGASSKGTVFTVKTDGTGFALLHSFAGGTTDGVAPQASLVLDGAGNLYGTSTQGGAAGQGTVFTVKTNGTGFTLLHSFAGAPSDGGYPYASLVLDGSGNLYGTTVGGGASSAGTVYTLKTNGDSFALLHSFGYDSVGGASPQSSLALDGAGNLYGTTTQGGASNQGTVFTVKTNGTDFAVLHTFAGWATDGADAQAEVVLGGSGTLFGTTFAGGVWNIGIVFALSTAGDLPPQELTVEKAGMGSGVVTSSPGGIGCGPKCSAWFVDSTPVTLSASASTDSAFAGWSGEGCSGTGTCQVTMDQARSVTATFDIACLPVTLSNLTITTTQTYTSCSTLTLGPAFRVEAPGNVTVRAAVRVSLRNGFSVGSGGTFAAGLDPSLAP
jgi:uncharacterized repeat protein (TIGR03803 family)